jgi:hypothetical protein
LKDLQERQLDLKNKKSKNVHVSNNDVSDELEHSFIETSKKKRKSKKNVYVYNVYLHLMIKKILNLFFCFIK